MRYAIKGLGLSAALAAGCLAGAVPSAAAAPAQPQGLYAPSALVLTVGEGEDPATSTVRRAVVLRCSPAPGGDHPAPARACGELRAVNGEFAALAEARGDRMCPMIWDPVTVTADGVWEGRRVSYARTFPNACVMADTAPAVFSF
ncbi:subtilase-type protease inhibitor [Streptomyces sp. DH37]|uniref:subtilase-type protease inhibitor n=1 Tax=Streptomyces sp. DH37 TaxID=3040122 RepID=UPI002441E218|nr:subtilase-type protease inhibitor [Streptomyces sp. DH37]MDG9700714.1 subtilase-type protease inhibitor [Streptomyces sp. DH37]